MAFATATTATAALLLRGVTRYGLRMPPCAAALCRSCYTASSLSAAPPHAAQRVVGVAIREDEPRPPSSRPALLKAWVEHPEYRKWKDKESEILTDVQPTILLAKDILHSTRYRDGQRLSDEDEKLVAEKILAFHPHSEDKIGCGLDSIMVDRHPEFKNSRCLFVVRTDGGWIDFSYQKCLRAYIRSKYPVDADRFIKEHFKRT